MFKNGKNFEAITQYFNTRQKRYKIDAVQRSKEQIRHFFYRTWHKISKYISLPKGINHYNKQFYFLNKKLYQNRI